MKFLLVLLLLISPMLNVNSETPEYVTVGDEYVYGNDVWYTSNNLYGTPGWGSSSFYWGVTKSEFRDKEGYYMYRVWFLSNSYIWDYSTESSIWKYNYVTNVRVYLNNALISGSDDGFSFRELYSAGHLSFRSRIPNPHIAFSCAHKIL